MLDKAGVDYIKGILDDREKSLLKDAAKNETLMEAIKKVVLAAVYNNGTLKPGEAANPLRNFMLASSTRRDEMTNEQIGAQTRAIRDALEVVEIGFAYVDNFKYNEPKVENKPNKAR